MNKRFTASIRVHVRDNIFGNAILVNASWNGKTADELLKQAEAEFNKYLGMMTADVGEKELHNHAKYLKDVNGWGIKKIKNHFAKFDIDIDPYIDPQKKLIE